MLQYLKQLKSLVDIIALIALFIFAISVGGWLSYPWLIGSCVFFALFTYMRTRQQD